MKRFIVHGTYMEYMAILHVMTHSPVEASIAWSAAFEGRVNDAWHVDVWDLDGKEAFLEKEQSPLERRWRPILVWRLHVLPVRRNPWHIFQLDMPWVLRLRESRTGPWSVPVRDSLKRSQEIDCPGGYRGHAELRGVWRRFRSLFS